MQDLVKKYINSNFNISDSRFPMAICATCRKTLHEYKNHIYKRPLVKTSKFELMDLTKITRNTKSCECELCQTARYKGHKKN